MKTGAVALIDALGFRGIWGRHKSEDVLNDLRSMKEWMEQRVQLQFSPQPWMHCDVAFLSDTIVISMELDPSTQNRDAMAVVYLCDVVSWILERTLRSRIPLAYRGAITLGDYEVSPHFLIGQAVDDAASAHNLAQGAIIWLTPPARHHVGEWLKNQPQNTHLVKFDVPLKGGDTYTTYTVSPLEQSRGQDDANLLVRSLLSTFLGSSMDVALKRQNTIRHLRACYAWRNYKFPPDLTNE